VAEVSGTGFVKTYLAPEQKVRSKVQALGLTGKKEKDRYMERALFPAIPLKLVFGLERDNDAATE